MATNGIKMLLLSAVYILNKFDVRKGLNYVSASFVFLLKR